MWKKIRRRLGRALFLKNINKLTQRIAKNEVELEQVNFEPTRGLDYIFALNKQIGADKQQIEHEKLKRKKGWRGIVRAAWSWRAYRDLREQKFIKSISQDSYINARDALIRLDLLELGQKKGILSDREMSELITLRRQKKISEKIIVNYNRAISLDAKRKERKSTSSRESSPHTSERK